MTGNQPKVSIIIPIYNADKYLNQTLNSLTEQTLKDIEIICVNDCSTDKSKQIIEHFSKQDPRIRLIDHDQNKGAGLARKSGILASTGEYIMFLDGDDFFRPDACRIAYRQITEAAVDMVQFGTEIIASSTTSRAEVDGLKTLLRPYDHNLKFVRAGELIQACFERQLFGFSIWNKIYNGSIVRKAITYYEEERFDLGEDLYLFYLIAMFSKTYSSVNERLYYYRFGAGITGGKVIDNRNIENQIRQGRVHRLLAKFSERFDPNGITELSLRAIETRFSDGIIRGWSQIAVRASWQTQLPLMFECFNQKKALCGLMKLYDSYDYRKKVDLIDSLKASKAFESEKRIVKTVGTFYHRMHNGGVERVISKLIPIWIAQGMNVILFTDEIESPADYEYPDSVIRIVLPDISNRTSEEYYRRISFLQNMLQRYSVDIMVYHAWVGNSLEADILATKSLHIPFVVHAHGFFGYGFKVDYAPAAYRNILIQRLFSLTDAIVTLTKTDYSWWSMAHEHVYKTLNPLTFELPEIDEQQELSSTDILWLGRISPEKQPLDALNILSLIVKTGKDVTLHFVGKAETREYEEYLKGKAEELQLTPYIEWHGFQRDVMAFYKKTGVFLLTSEFEGSPMTLAESLSCGVPAVVYDLPNVDLAKNNEGVRVVAQSDAAAAANAIVEILTDRELQRRMSRAARRSVEEMYSFDIPGLWMSIFKDIGEKRPTPSTFDRDSLCNAIRMMNDFLAKGIEVREFSKSTAAIAAESPVSESEYKDITLQLYRSGKIGFRYIVKYILAWIRFKLSGKKD